MSNPNSFVHDHNGSHKLDNNEVKQFKVYNERKIRNIKQLEKFDPAIVEGIELAATVFPFKINNYVIDSLIDWSNGPDDPMFRLTFPHLDMLGGEGDRLSWLKKNDAGTDLIMAEVRRIRSRLNPHSSAQTSNLPVFEGKTTPGIQHKYVETVLFFPKQGQTCHTYCSFCFRWPQFVESGVNRFESDDADLLHRYLRAHPMVSDLLLTGGDPMVMNARRLRSYLEPLLAPEYSHVRNLRIGTKALTYWPFRFLTDPDAEDLLALLQALSDGGKHVAIMAHVNHWKEMTTPAFHAAVAKLRRTGATIRTQSPLLRHINDDAATWRRTWADALTVGIVPYYMFIERDTGASYYFGVPLARALSIYQQAVGSLSGLGRTVRGPVMSAAPGKVHLLGTLEQGGRKQFVLSLHQARNPSWLNRIFLAEYSNSATWIDQLMPVDGAAKFPFEDSMVQTDEGDNSFVRAQLAAEA